MIPTNTIHMWSVEMINIYLNVNSKNPWKCFDLSAASSELDESIEVLLRNRSGSIGSKFEVSVGYSMRGL